MGEDVLDDAWDDTSEIAIGQVSAHHGEGLAGARLSVSKDGAVVAVEDVVDGRLDGVVEDILLGRVDVKYPVESKAVVDVAAVDLDGVGAVEGDDGLGRTVARLDLVDRPKSVVSGSVLASRNRGWWRK